MTLKLSNGLHRLLGEYRMLLRAPYTGSAGRDAADVVDWLIGSEDVFKHIQGKNDLAVINGLITAAALWTATHCEYTGQSFDETEELVKSCFDSAFGIARAHIERKQANG